MMIIISERSSSLSLVSHVMRIPAVAYAGTKTQIGCAVSTLFSHMQSWHSQDEASYDSSSVCLYRVNLSVVSYILLNHLVNNMYIR